MNQFKSGFVSLIGRPNVGKSTLMNSIVGQKVSIVSSKVQTTRRRILGIASGEKHQIVFVDTPGIHKAHTELGKILNTTATSALEDVDIILAVVDSSTPPGANDASIADLIKATSFKDGKHKIPVLLCLNKMDLLKPEHVKEHVERYTELFATEEYMFTCFTKKQNVDKLTDLILQHLPEGEPIYPLDQVTDLPMRTLAAELIREKALHLTKKEVPYSITVQVEDWKEIPEKNITHISAAIIIEREGHKPILIGKNGAMLKEIGTRARKEIEENLEKKVFLELFVKVRKDWRSNPRMLKDLDFM